MSYIDQPDTASWQAHSTPDPDQPPPDPKPTPVPDDVPPPVNAPVEEPTLPVPPIKAGWM